MLRKTMIALFTVASIGMLAPSVASARGGGSFGAGGGFHGGGFGGGGFRGGGFGGGGFHSAAIGGGGFRGGGFRSAAIASGGFRSRAFAADGFRHGRRFAFGAFDDYYSDYGYPYYDYGYYDDAYTWRWRLLRAAAVRTYTVWLAYPICPGVRLIPCSLSSRAPGLVVGWPRHNEVDTLRP